MGQGEEAFHDRLRYVDSREEIMAEGFADLFESFSLLLNVGENNTYCSTILTFCDRMAASSLTKCGLLPVFCSCIMTPSTISSFIPSKSISLGCTSSSRSSVTASGEGGGVFSYFTTDIETRFGGGDIEGESSWGRFIFFVVGISVLESIEGGESRAAALAA